VTETSKVVDVLLPLGRKQHSCVQGHSFCLHYTLCLMQLSVVRNLILEGCSDDIPVSGLLVIDAVGWRSMYFAAMPRVNLIVILMTYCNNPSFWKIKINGFIKIPNFGDNKNFYFKYKMNFLSFKTCEFEHLLPCFK
jgi:hypothetical protein